MKSPAVSHCPSERVRGGIPFRTVLMSTTQLTIALAIAALVNQWALAIFNKRAQQATPKTKPVNSVAPKAKRSLRLYVTFGADLAILIFAAHTLWEILSIASGEVATIRNSVDLSFLVFVIGYQTHRAIRSFLALLFP